MKENKIMLQLKEVVRCYVSGNKILNNPVGKIGESKMPCEINDFIRKFIDLLLNTNFLTIESKLYIRKYSLNYSGVKEVVNSINKSPVTISTIKSKILKDQKKIERYFGKNMLTELIGYKYIYNLNEYKKALFKIQVAYSNSMFLNRALALKLPKTKEYTGDYKVTDKEFYDFMDDIVPYLKSSMKFVSLNIISKDVLAYCRYILDNTELSKEDLQRKNFLVQHLI